MRIAICDDEIIFANYLSRIIGQYLKDKDMVSEINIFTSGQDFVELGAEILTYDIVFLDINMDKMDGLLNAKKIREVCRSMILIFVTAFISYTLEGYKVEAFRYILKNTVNFELSMREALDAVCEKMKEKKGLMEFMFRTGKRRLSVDEIVYIESRLHELEFHILESEITVYRMKETLNRVEAKIENSHFLRIHQSYLVNMKYLKKIKSQQAILIDETILPVSKSRYKEARFKLTEYRGDMT